MYKVNAVQYTSVFELPIPRNIYLFKNNTEKGVKYIQNSKTPEWYQ